MREIDLVRWGEVGRGRRSIVIDGEMWRVAFPGRGPAQAGPDFRGARV